MGNTLSVEFVKVSDQACLARARRADSAMIETTATAKDGLPHDLEHLIVEAALDCHQGFWGRVWRGAEFANINVIHNGPRRRPRSHNRELTKGYNGWNEDLVTKVAAVLDEATARGWSPPGRLPDVPALAVLLDARRRPPVEAIIDRGRMITAVTELFEARRAWSALPIGESLTHTWQRRQRRG
ncbi:hypothetical protein [Catenulispora pinisilvae]|uniref:hypothetical protein n=1 Tax=Catenulispora pinisilvae TaxID=2705253 RepID=UPI001891ED50|nr:hypothetical protein [Catenulispora pinisilvae]